MNRSETDFVKESIRQKGRNIRRLIGTVAAVFVVLLALTLFSVYQADVATNEANTRATAEVLAIMEGNKRATAEIVAIDNAATAVAEANDRATAQANEAIARSLAEEKQAEAEREAAIARARELAALVDLDLRDGNIARALRPRSASLSNSPHL